MPPHQIFARLARRARGRWLYPLLGERLFPPPSPLPACLHNPTGAKIAPPALSTEELRSAADELAAHRFTYLNLPTADLGSPVDWQHSPEGNRLWGYQLHYGHWALTLAHAARAAPDATTRYREALIGLLRDWIEHNLVGRAPAWDPDPIARRLVTWSKLPCLLGGDATWDAFWRTALEPSLRRQARCLAANLEHDVPNNHLIGNYRALAWVGLLFEHWPESEGWRKVGLKGLWWEMDRQILPDGVHDERSLSYHPIVLRDLFETWQLARRRGVDTPSHLSETLGKMLCFLVATRTPNGTWPMVNDSVPTYPEDRAALIDSVTSALEQPSERPNRVDDAGVSAFPEAGYAILRPTPDDYLFFDAGPMGPTQVPGHGHADALSFVLYGNGRPLIVDPGVDTYEAGQRRDELRSIAVHNTVTVDDQEPCTFWGPFRVTDLPGACLIEWSESHLLGQHQGYKRLAHGVTHHRRITWLDDGCWEIHDRFEGVGEHTFALNLQLAPGAQVDLEGLDAVARWSDGTQLVMRPDVPLAEARTEIVEGWVAPDWNRRVAASRYLLRWNAQVPFELRTRLEVDIV